MVSLSEREIGLDLLMPLIKERLAVGQSVRFGPKGTSMLPMLRQGIDNVVLSPLPGKLKKYDLPLYQRENGQYVLHRIVKAGDTYTCIGDNQYVLEHGVRHDQMIGVVTAFYRGEKRWKVNCAAYWLYCRFWHISRTPRHYWYRLKAKIRGLLK